MGLADDSRRLEPMSYLTRQQGKDLMVRVPAELLMENPKVARYSHGVTYSVDQSYSTRQ